MTEEEERVQLLEKGLLRGLACTLATVEHYAMLRSISMRELYRQISIAQQLLDCLFHTKVYPQDSRGLIVIEQYDKSVWSWAWSIRNQWVSDKPLKRI